jgi:tetratricopeptide (TPR) repeat protein
MMRERFRRAAIAAIMVGALAGSITISRQVTLLKGGQPDSDEVLYLQSSKNLKRFSLGYSGLLANIYWTRAVQYFGRKHLTRSTHYNLLYPLLDIATDLDPQLIVAYQDGAVFLSGSPPGGAGQSDKSVELLEKGIRANPGYWRLYFTLGFVQYMDRKDYAAAREAFDRGSQVPGALPWMKSMAATMAQHAGESSTAAAIWSRLYDSTEDPEIRQTAARHVASLHADMDITQLEQLIRQVHEKTGKLPTSWEDLVRLRVLAGIPVDPLGEPYRLEADGTVRVQHPEKFPFMSLPGSSPKSSQP